MKGTQYIVVDENEQIIMKSESLSDSVAIHSCAKPFQLLPVFLLGLDNKYQLSHRELTIMSSSMLAQDIHVDTVVRLIDKLNIQINDLLLAPSVPCGHIAFKNWMRAKKEPSIICNPCIGNHIAMFLVQRELSGSGNNYLSVDSLVQKMIFEILRDFCNCRRDEIHIGIDGCGAPCYSIPLQSLAAGYRNLCVNTGSIGNEYRSAVKKLRAAVNSCPRYLEGDGCLSTIISRNKQFIGKTGANGTLGMGIDKRKCGVAVFSPDGNWNAIADTISVILEKLGYDGFAFDRELA